MNVLFWNLLLELDERLSQALSIREDLCCHPLTGPVCLSNKNFARFAIKTPEGKAFSSLLLPTLPGFSICFASVDQAHLRFNLHCGPNSLDSQHSTPS